MVRKAVASKLKWLSLLAVVAGLCGFFVWNSAGTPSPPAWLSNASFFATIRPVKREERYLVPGDFRSIEFRNGKRDEVWHLFTTFEREEDLLWRIKESPSGHAQDVEILLSPSSTSSRDLLVVGAEDLAKTAARRDRIVGPNGTTWEVLTKHMFGAVLPLDKTVVAIRDPDPQVLVWGKKVRNALTGDPGWEKPIVILPGK
ncbi:MAG: hypothetical protein ACAH95_03715 [Fimbriimonas sp.]